MAKGNSVYYDIDPREWAEIKRRIQSLSKGGARRAVNRATREAGKPLLAAFKSEAPRDTGALADETRLRNFRGKAPDPGAFIYTPSRKRLAGVHGNKKGKRSRRQEKIRDSRSAGRVAQILHGPWYYPAALESKQPTMVPLLNRMSGSIRGALGSLFIRHLDAEIDKLRRGGK